VVERVIGAAIQVHRQLGPGLLESLYEAAVGIELEHVRMPFRRQVEIPVQYRGVDLGIGYRADLVVANCLVVELKTVRALEDIHVAQLMTYLRLLNIKRGLLFNFHVPFLRDGIRRVSI
jgi:GxxExxY protein